MKNAFLTSTFLLAITLSSVASTINTDMLNCTSTTNNEGVEITVSSNAALDISFECVDVILHLDEQGESKLNNWDVLSGLIFAESDITLSKSNFTCDDIGEHEVKVTVRGSSGGLETCTSNVLVVDLIAPVAICQDRTVSLNSEGNAAITYQHVEAGSYDNCSLHHFSLSQYDFTQENLGPNEVTITIMDSSGNISTCESIITINEAPKDESLDFLAAFTFPALEELPTEDPERPLIEENYDDLRESNTVISLYPNPVSNGVTNLVINHMNAGLKDIRLSVYNSLGVEISRIRSIIDQSDAKLKIEDLGNLPSGMYTAVVFIDNKRLSERFVIRNE